ncbi:uncharacterized protein [Euwallacea similis]|uniref:uncharacterized protein isoform X2 n=1 Tax=Euwallacea similis TaxID=1736056 RepID=UPI00344E02DA
MYRLVTVAVLIQSYFLESLASSDSCYYCSGTPQCGDPINYRDVQPRDCLEDSVCLKYARSSKSLDEEIITEELTTYRECFQPSVILNMDICDFVKTMQKEALDKLNQTLDAFQCSVCDTTNCNSAYRPLHSLAWIYLFYLSILYVLDW